MVSPEQLETMMQHMMGNMAQQMAQAVAQATSGAVASIMQGMSANQMPGGAVGGYVPGPRSGPRDDDVDDKYFKKLKPFKEQNWKDWAFQFRSAVKAANGIGHCMLLWAEKQGDVIDNFEEFDECNSEQAEEISSRIFIQLTQLVEVGSESMDILQNSDSCGAEAWRRLTRRFAPTTPLRGMHLMMQAVNPKRATQPREVAKIIERWETNVMALEKDFNERLSDKFKTAILLTMMPKELQDSLVQHTSRFDDYRDAREKALTIAESKVLLKDPDAMDIGAADREWREWQEEGFRDDGSHSDPDVLATGKGGIYCYRCGGQGHIAAKCGTPDPGKGSAKGGGKGKGKYGGGGKGKGGKGDWTGFCSYCGKRGHGPRDCWTKQRDESKKEEERQAAIASAEEDGGPTHDTCNVDVGGFDVAAVDLDSKEAWTTVMTKQSRRRQARTGQSGSASKFLGESPDVAAERPQAVSQKMYELNAVSSDHLRGRMTIDSGAAESVLPSGMLPHIKMQESVGSRKGVHYIAADGGRMPNLGEKRVPFKTSDGATSSVLFQVTNARKPLVSVARIVEKGNRVIFSQSGSYIENERTRRRIPIVAENGTYHLEVEFLDAVAASGFARQA